MSATTDPYEMRYVGFVDILGFGALVEAAHAQPERRKAIAEALKTAREVDAPHNGETGLSFHFFSDSIIASAHRTEDGLWHLLLALDSLAHNLLVKDIWVRGGVAVGGVYVDPDLVFGTGINRAYALESTIAVHPRIILGKQVMKDAEEYARTSAWSENYFVSRIRRDTDGVNYLHYLVDYVAVNGTTISEATKGAEEHPLVHQGNAIRAALQKRIDDAIENPAIYAKAKWFAQYWNDAVVNRNIEADLFLKSIALAGSSNTTSPLPFRGTPG
ncbi:MAG: hypothetical protein NXH78_01955 [Hyphomonadaceae bacterium]|nr:hypothetical protein [Hyphomonadaceae bacterium]